jgi:Family of unknown function (DUF5302)
MSQDPAQDPSRDELDDVKAKMRAALERKKSRARGGGQDGDAPVREKAHGSEVHGGATPKMHRRKSG